MKTLRLVAPAVLLAAAAPAFTRPSGGDRPPARAQRPVRPPTNPCGCNNSPPRTY